MADDREDGRQGRGDRGRDDRAVYIISVAAELAGVHPQTLRIYERKGLLRPARTKGNTRRYSQRDIDQLRTIQELTQDAGVNLAGVKMIVEMQAQLKAMRREAERLAGDLARARQRAHEDAARLRAGSGSAEIVPLSAARRIRLRVARVAPSRDVARSPIPLGPASAAVVPPRPHSTTEKD
jgi:MerR family transcriptional regulator, heat shock protein HspR